jgi:hypothetical protein
MDYRDQTFRNQTIDIDENQYFGCTFENVVFRYEGGTFTFDGCIINRPQFLLAGNLGNGLESLRAFHHAGGPKGVKALVEGVTALLRRKDPIITFRID